MKKAWIESHYIDEPPERYQKCFYCKYWHYDCANPQYAPFEGSTIEIGWCTCQEAGAPYVEGLKGFEVPAPTRETNRCDAFVASEDALIEWREERDEQRHYVEMDDNLRRDAWR